MLKLLLNKNCILNYKRKKNIEKICNWHKNIILTDNVISVLNDSNFGGDMLLTGPLVWEHQYMLGTDFLY